MTTQDFITENRTATFNKGETVQMHTCIEAETHKGKLWTCKTDSYKDRAGQDVVFLEGFSGCFHVSFCNRFIKYGTKLKNRMAMDECVLIVNYKS